MLLLLVVVCVGGRGGRVCVWGGESGGEEGERRGGGGGRGSVRNWPGLEEALFLFAPTARCHKQGRPPSNHLQKNMARPPTTANYQHTRRNELAEPRGPTTQNHDTSTTNHDLTTRNHGHTSKSTAHKQKHHGGSVGPVVFALHPGLAKMNCMCGWVGGFF